MKTEQRIAAITSAAQCISSALDQIETAADNTLTALSALEHDELFGRRIDHGNAAGSQATRALQQLRTALLAQLRDLGALPEG